MREGQPPRRPPPPSSNFTRKKEHILAQLAVPEAEYSDASPKGSVDAGIRELIGEINALEGFVTTSSCAGRVSVFVEGSKAGEEAKEGEGGMMRLGGEASGGGGDGEGRDGDGDVDEGGMAGPSTTTVAAVGGKGGGGAWLFVSHDPVVVEEGADVRGLLGLRGGSTDHEGERGGFTTKERAGGGRLVHFKFEPMVSLS